MRITQFSKYRPIEQSIQELQGRKYLNELRLATGKQVVDITDTPNLLVEKKRFEHQIQMQQQYKKNIEYSINFIQHTSETLDSIANNINKIKEISISATQISVAQDVSTLGKQIRGLLEDIVRDLNSDFDGQFLFSGNILNSEYIPILPGTKRLPYEIIQEAPSAENPSGLKVVFKGNTKKLVVNTSKVSSEVINTTADEIFGDSSLSGLNKIVELYNLFTYNKDGTLRREKDLFNKDDLTILEKLQKEIGKMYDKIIAANSRNGALLNRFEAMKEHSANMITALEGYKSKVSDTDYASTTIQLNKDQTTLQFTLQVAARLSQVSLFDFLR
ncbi:MAG: flagellin [Candidatus Kapaibacteriota bacterium]